MSEDEIGSAYSYSRRKSRLLLAQQAADT